MNNSEGLYQIALDIENLSNILFQSISVNDDRKHLREWVQAEIYYKLKTKSDLLKSEAKCSK